MLKWLFFFISQIGFGDLDPPFLRQRLCSFKPTICSQAERKKKQFNYWHRCYAHCSSNKWNHDYCMVGMHVPAMHIVMFTIITVHHPQVRNKWVWKRVGVCCMHVAFGAQKYAAVYICTWWKKRDIIQISAVTGFPWVGLHVALSNKGRV